ncbi:hypothetical protein H4219_001894 [Mycoemilia scoparia]|uniref:Endonuclease V n=1 Tax=Mycoemilia scoparia TaxID=417184 RepID=A0A9W8A4Q2_9FUNG|nr:hypothetical protein H4219_001894 [Mycoemilia scoparia]
MEPSASQIEEWDRTQEQLRQQLCLTDSIDFTPTYASDGDKSGSIEGFDNLRYIAGMDISYPRNRDDVAVAAYVILEYPSLKANTIECLMTVPYKAGYLAFKELPHFLTLHKRLIQKRPELVPQVLFVDGNGVLHPRKFGSACHIGVSLNIPTIGVAKNFLQLTHNSSDEILLTMNGVKSKFKECLVDGQNVLHIKDKSGFIYGAALAPTPEITSPIFVSVGHRVSLDVALALTSICCKFRVPEPIRHADIISRIESRKIEDQSK